MGERGHYSDAAHMFEEAIDAARQAGERGPLVVALINLGDLAMRQADYLHAIPLCEEALAVSRELGHQDWIAISLYNLALCFHRTGRAEDAVSAAKASLLISQEFQGVGHVIECVVLLGSVAGHRGDAEVGATLMGASDALRKRVGLTLMGAEAQLHGETVQELRRALGEKAYETALAQGRTMSLDRAVEYALETD